MRVVDCFSFHNELDLLNLRLRLLSPVVERFLVIEACKTHSGRDKEPILRNLLRAGSLQIEPEILRKLTVHTLEDFPSGFDSWERERFQRDFATHLLQSDEPTGSPTGVFVSDLDEIPHPEFVRWLGMQREEDRLIPVTMWQCYFRPNFVRVKGEEREWSGPFFSSLRFIVNQGSLSEMRERARQKENFMAMPEGRFRGWHLSYQGGDVFIRAKREAFAHQEDRVQKVSIPIDTLIRERKGPFDEREGPGQWAVLPLEALGMPKVMAEEPFIRSRALPETDNLGNLFLAGRPPSKEKKWSLRGLLNRGKEARV